MKKVPMIELENRLSTIYSDLCNCHVELNKVHNDLETSELNLCQVGKINDLCALINFKLDQLKDSMD